MMLVQKFETVALLMMVAGAIFVASACEDTGDVPERPEPAAARAPTSVGEEPEKDEQPETPETDDVPQKAGLDLTWFKGVDNLPEAHPCHDSTKVIHAEMQAYDDPMRVGDPFEYESSTLGELREELGPRWVHFGPRTARGVRWSRGDEEFLVATCNMGGVGYHPFRDTSFLEGEGVDMAEARQAEFIIGHVGEASATEWGSLYWMHRNSPHKPWRTLDHWDAMSNADEGNKPQHTVRARIIEAADSDGDGRPEVIAMELQDRQSWEHERMREHICPDERPSHYCFGFELEIVIREGDQVLTDRIMLRQDGRHALTQKAEQPKGMNDEVFEHLRAQLDEHRDHAVIKARAILKEDEKLR